MIAALAKKLGHLRGGRGRTREPGAEEPVRREASSASATLTDSRGVKWEAHEVSEPALSEAGRRQVAAVQADLAAKAAALQGLAAAFPGYLAAVEAEERCRALGLSVTLATLAGRS